LIGLNTCTSFFVNEVLDIKRKILKRTRIRKNNTFCIIKNKGIRGGQTQHAQFNNGK